MHVVITGAAGFLGQELTRALLQRETLVGSGGLPERIDRLTLVDVVAPAGRESPRVRVVTGDISDRAVLERVIDEETGSVFHLAAIVSGMAEAQFDLGMRINVDATRLLLDVCRAAGGAPRVVFTSSVAVFGGDLPALVLDDTGLNPQTSYGVQKAIGEFLIGDYTRKGFIDGRSLRLPTVSVRPGRPNAAASSFASGIVREPLSGEAAVCPVGERARLWLISPSTAVACLLAGHDIASERLGHNRSLNLPGISVTAGEMVASLARVAGPHVAARVTWELDPRIDRMVAGWPGAFDPARARALGFPVDESFDQIIRDYMARSTTA